MSSVGVYQYTTNESSYMFVLIGTRMVERKKTFRYYHNNYYRFNKQNYNVYDCARCVFAFQSNRGVRACELKKKNVNN